MRIKRGESKHLWLSAIIFICLCTPLQAQMSNSGGDFWSRVRYGGGLGLSFGREAVQIGLAPSAIYQINNYAAVGVGLNYTYSKFFDTKLNAYGGSVIGLVNPIPALQLSGEFEQLRVQRSAPGFSDSYWLPALYLGVGYAAGPVTFGVRFDVLYDDERSLYADPWVPFVRVFF